jgi:hypothetical protein
MERRRSQRHQRNFSVGWRKLGSRESRLEPAQVRDLSASGVGLLLPSEFDRGTILIIEITGVSGRFAEPILLRVERTSEQDEGQWLVGCSFTRAFSERETKELLTLLTRRAPSRAAAPKPAAEPAPEEEDPFVAGSKQERRRSLRRKGLATAVTFSHQGNETAHDGTVVDCSLDGIGIASPVPVVPGTLLKVRISAAHDGTLSLKLRVRQCRKQSEGAWHLGCQFIEKPTSTVLMQFH